MLNAALQREKELWVQKRMAELLPQIEAQVKAKVEAEAKAELKAKVKAEMMMELLNYRFGSLDDQLRDRLRQLSIAQLAALPWSVLDAKSHDEVAGYLDAFAAE